MKKHNIKKIFTLSVIAALMPTYAVASLSLVQKEAAPERFIVKFKENSPSSAISSFGMSPFWGEGIAQRSTLDRFNAKNIAQIGSQSAYAVELSEQDRQELNNNLDVEYIEVDPPRYLLSEHTPWGQGSVKATLVSDNQAGNRTVCIIDSGYDRAHNDLSGNQVTGVNNKGTGDWFAPGLGNSHGTHVAGTIAAIANNSGVVGVMPNQIVNLHIAKVFKDGKFLYSSGLVGAIDTCVANGADVINMSLGGPAYSRTERDALATHYQNGVLLIAAAGNDGNSQHSYPASYDSTVSVAAVDSNKQHAGFSQTTNQVELSGPGESILSTVVVGDGRLADITIAGVNYFDQGVVPHNRYIYQNGDPLASPINSGFTGEMAECDTSTGAYNCGSMAEKICLVERLGDEIDAVNACYKAGAKASIVYSNAQKPGLQNPFLVDRNNTTRIPSVSVDRALGQTLLTQVGSETVLSITGGEDYQYYNGTSMATPHVAGVAALVWSYAPQCSAAQVRKALTSTAEDLEAQGRDNQTGYGLVNTEAAKEWLEISCDGPNTGPATNELSNGKAVSDLSGARGSETLYTIEVPAGATNLNVKLQGGTGDADLYIKANGQASTSSSDCKSEQSSNNETCTVATPKAGTYSVLVYGYGSYSGASLTASFDTAGTNPTGPLTLESTQAVAIPDNSSVGISSSINMNQSRDAGEITVSIDISHSYIGDLRVMLTSPRGEQAELHSNTGSSQRDLVQAYTANFTGVAAQGSWTLSVVDSGRLDTGTLNKWSITFP